MIFPDSGTTGDVTSGEKKTMVSHQASKTFRTKNRHRGGTKGRGKTAGRQRKRRNEGGGQVHNAREAGKTTVVSKGCLRKAMKGVQNEVL